MIRVGGALACLAVGCLIVQSVAALLLPAPLVPDLVLLVAVACALTVPSAAGMLVVALAGFGADLLSGSLLGHHALLRLGAFAFTWAISAQFHLKRALPLMVLVFCLAAADALLQMGLTRLFAGIWLVAPEDRTAGTACQRPVPAGGARSHRGRPAQGGAPGHPESDPLSGGGPWRGSWDRARR